MWLQGQSHSWEAENHRRIFSRGLGARSLKSMCWQARAPLMAPGGLSHLLQPLGLQASLGMGCIPPASVPIVTWLLCLPPSLIL